MSFRCCSNILHYYCRKYHSVTIPKFHYLIIAQNVAPLYCSNVVGLPLANDPLTKRSCRKVNQTEEGVWQSGLHVSQNGLQVARMRNLRCAIYLFFQLLQLFQRNANCALCLFFQRLRNVRLRIGKSDICCVLIANFFPRCAITK